MLLVTVCDIFMTLECYVSHNIHSFVIVE